MEAKELEQKVKGSENLYKNEGNVSILKLEIWSSIA